MDIIHHEKEDKTMPKFDYIVKFEQITLHNPYLDDDFPFADSIPGKAFEKIWCENIEELIFDEDYTPVGYGWYEDVYSNKQKAIKYFNSLKPLCEAHQDGNKIVINFLVIEENECTETDYGSCCRIKWYFPGFERKEN